MAEIETRVLTETTIAAPIDAVWAALRDLGVVANWFGWDADTLKDEIDFIFGTVMADEAGKRLDFGEWEGNSDHFELFADGDRTLLRVTRRSADLAAADTYDAVVEGWISFVAQLRLLLERHAGASRRTIFLSAKFDSDRKPLSTALKVHGLRDARVGSPYMADLGIGEIIQGEVWNRSRYQLGLQVDAWGDGLLVVTDSPSGGNVIVTTFGLPDAAFAALKARWEDWWAATYPPA